eukprot:1204942-Prymnesium_polylepis.1
MQEQHNAVAAETKLAVLERELQALTGTAKKEEEVRRCRCRPLSGRHSLAPFCRRHRCLAIPLARTVAHSHRRSLSPSLVPLFTYASRPRPQPQASLACACQHADVPTRRAPAASGGGGPREA